MSAASNVAPVGELSLRVIHGGNEKDVTGKLSMSDIVEYGFPHAGQDKEVRRWKRENLINLLRGVRTIAMARALKLPHFHGALWLKVLKGDGREFDLGLVGLRVVTDTGVAFIVDAFQNIVEVELMKFHGIGEDSTAEAQTQADLIDELTTEYNPDNTRATGTTAEAAANIYQTVATNTVDATPVGAIREHGIFDNATKGSGVLLDRTVFGAINLSSGDGIQSTYELTLTAGS